MRGVAMLATRARLALAIASCVSSMTICRVTGFISTQPRLSFRRDRAQRGLRRCGNHAHHVAAASKGVCRVAGVRRLSMMAAPEDEEGSGEAGPQVRREGREACG